MLATEIEDFEKNNKWKGELSVAQNFEFGCMAYCWHFWRSQSHKPNLIGRNRVESQT